MLRDLGKEVVAVAGELLLADARHLEELVGRAGHFDAHVAQGGVREHDVGRLARLVCDALAQGAQPLEQSGIVGAIARRKA